MYRTRSDENGASNQGKKEQAVVSHTLQLALLSPEIIRMALIGTLPADITLKNFKAGLPAAWEAQKKFLGI